MCKTEVLNEPWPTNKRLRTVKQVMEKTGGKSQWCDTAARWSVLRRVSGEQVEAKEAGHHTRQDGGVHILTQGNTIHDLWVGWPFIRL